MKFNKAKLNINNIKGKGKEMDCNKDLFPTQPTINPHSIAFLDSK